MSTQRGIRVALDRFAASFNKDGQWAGRVESTWSAGLQDVSDKDLMTAINRMCTRVFQYPPTLGHVVEECQAVIKEQGGTGLAGNIFQFCADCERYEGIVHISAHFLKLEEDQYKVYNAGTSCTCEGARAKFGKSGLSTWVELKDKMEMDTRLRLDHFYKTSRRQLVLPESVRNPEFDAKVKAAEQEAIRAGGFNKFLWAVQRMAQTSGLRLDDNGNIVGEVHVVPDQPAVRPQTQPQPTQQPTTNEYGGMSDEEFWRNH
jgi:hypothetical protein